MRKFLVLAGLILSVLGVFIFHWPWSSDLGPPESQEPLGQAVGPEEAPAPGGGREGGVRVPIGPPGGVGEPPLLAEIPKAERLRILVLSEKEGRPLPGAEAAWLLKEGEAPATFPLFSEIGRASCRERV